MKDKSYLLATDLDHTLVGDPSSLSNLFTHYQKQQFDVALVYVTGRHLDSALNLIEKENLPIPNILITDVGAAVYLAPDWKEDEVWSAWINETWTPDEILRLSQNFPSLIKQDLPHQRRISFTLDPDQAELVQAVKQNLKQHEILHHIVFSSGRDLDILPERSGKGKAVDYVLRKYAKPEVHVLLAGDSGNDAEMLSLDYPAVIVGNAQIELDELPFHPLLYRATEHYAAGIQEAWDYYYPKTQ
ncbi:HAD-IIB family hydrolase [Sporosarcina obsidiansis]|uniref:HAD-IIB family hydrolase n=1 Tax=Sporosarcina obsidiansis TaxID=2660748 RepID=UPI00129AB9A8|nr:HAD-IIB family hydrolase [Sporosarcina obsidiansis]